MPRSLSVHIAMAVALVMLAGRAPSASAESARYANRTAWLGDDRSAAAQYGGKWAEFPPQGNRDRHSMIYDPTRERLVVFGGSESSDVWVFDLAQPQRWTRLIPSGTPPAPRAEHSAIYDPVGDRMIVFAGYDASGSRADVWGLSLAGNGEWTELTPLGTAPNPRAGHSAVYDPTRNRMVVYGGFGPPEPETWALSLSEPITWTQIETTGPVPLARGSHAAIFDPMRDRMVMFGGGFEDVFNDTWELSFAADPPVWAQLSPAGSPPVPRWAHSAVLDADRDRMVVFGGYFISGIHTLESDETWVLDLAGSTAWTQLLPSGTAPPGRAEHAAIYDPGREALVIASGFGFTLLSDTWSLSLSGTPTWTQLGDVVPRQLGSGAGVYDPIGNRMVCVCYSNETTRLEVWTLALDGNLKWTHVTPIGTPPGFRLDASAIYDPLRRRLVLFGGSAGNGIALNDAWALTLESNLEWIELLPSGSLPPARSRHTAVYDGHRDRMLIYAGMNAGGYTINDAYALSFSGGLAWEAVVPTDYLYPPRRQEHVAIYDALRDRMLVFGGSGDSGIRNDVWVFSFDAGGDSYWTQLAPAETLPAPRSNAVGIYDPDRDRLVVHGGFDFIDWFNDVWELPLDGSEWTQLLPQGPLPSAGIDEIAVYDSADDRMITFGGYYRNELWLLDWSAPTAIADPRQSPTHVAFQYLGPNPISDHATIRFQLRKSGPVRLDVFDVSGRRVRELLTGTISEGAHEVIWDGRGDDGRTMPSAVYFFRLATESGTLIRKAVRIPSGD